MSPDAPLPLDLERLLDHPGLLRRRLVLAFMLEPPRLMPPVRLRPRPKTPAGGEQAPAVQPQRR